MTPADRISPEGLRKLAAAYEKLDAPVFTPELTRALRQAADELETWERKACSEHAAAIRAEAKCDAQRVELERLQIQCEDHEAGRAEAEHLATQRTIQIDQLQARLAKAMAVVEAARANYAAAYDCLRKPTSTEDAENQVGRLNDTCAALGEALAALRADGTGGEP